MNKELPFSISTLIDPDLHAKVIQAFCPERRERQDVMTIYMTQFNTIAKAKHRNPTEDLFLLVDFYAHYGTKIAKATKFMEDSYQIKMAEIKEAYDIKHTTPESKYDLTMSRIMGCVPHLVIRAMSKPGTKALGVPGLIPRALMFPGASAIFPYDPQWSITWSMWRRWAQTFSKVIGGKNTEIDYHSLRRRSPYISARKRLEIMDNAGVTPFKAGDITMKKIEAFVDAANQLGVAMSVETVYAESQGLQGFTSEF